MLRFIAWRILAGAVAAVVLTALVFTLIYRLLGDPAYLILGREASAEAVAKLREQMGFNRPLYVQYAGWLIRTLRGDLGRSLRDHLPVGDAIRQRLVVTVELTTLAMMLSLLVGLLVGTLAGVSQHPFFESLVSSSAIASVTLPNFLVGILLILVFAVKLGVLPTSSYVVPWERPIEHLRAMILPVATLSLAYIGMFTLVLKASVRNVTSELYVQTARAKGLTKGRVVWRHVLKNSLIPLVTILGLEWGRLFGGAVITESIFALPGIGRLLVDSLLSRDFPVIQALLALIVFGVLGVNMLVDLAYGFLDPRIAYR